MKLPTLKKHKTESEALDPVSTPPERPRAHESHGATACEVCGTIGSEPTCPVDGHAR